MKRRLRHRPAPRHAHPRDAADNTPPTDADVMYLEDLPGSTNCECCEPDSGPHVLAVMCGCFDPQLGPGPVMCNWDPARGILWLSCANCGAGAFAVRPERRPTTQTQIPEAYLR